MASRRTSKDREETIEQFKGIVASAKDLIDRGLIKVRLSLPASVDLEFNADQIKPILKLQAIDIDDFDRILNRDVSEMMSAILSKRRKGYISFILRTKREAAEETKFDEEQEKKVLEEKVSTVEKSLISDSLRRQLAIKTTSKTGVLYKLSWEIDEKHYDETVAQPEHLFYAILRLELQKTPVPEQRFFPFSLFGIEKDTIVFTASIEDIEELCDTIINLKSRLEELRKSGR